MKEKYCQEVVDYEKLTSMYESIKILARSNRYEVKDPILRKAKGPYCEDLFAHMLFDLRCDKQTVRDIRALADKGYTANNAVMLKYLDCFDGFGFPTVSSVAEYFNKESNLNFDISDDELPF